tara:strand:+ start:925 stop:1098 length:174 start_codon:yes stop_codon:yes gene_type:complete
MIELGMEVETSCGSVGQVVASPRFGKGWLIRLINGKELRLKDEELREVDLKGHWPHC